MDMQSDDSSLAMIRGIVKSSRALHRFTLSLLFGALAAATMQRVRADEPPHPDDLASRVVILANSSDPESLRVADYYRAKRAIPAENVIALPMSREETISWREFVDTIFEPLRAELIQKHWIDSFDTPRKDKLGRKLYPISGHRISYLVTCRGVPLRVGPGYELYHEMPPPLLDQPEFRTNQGAVDSELSLVVRNDYRINGFIPNPLFGKEHPSFIDLNAVVKVARLDGPTQSSALNLVDGALTAERDGLIGRAYVDYGSGPYSRGEDWFRSVAKQLAGSHFDLLVDDAAPLLPVTARFDAPALYFGWHSPDINGPFLQPEFRFPPGAIALHLHSFSAYTIRGDLAGWCGPLLARGVTATFGNVFEPYLEFTHRPDMLVEALLRGDSLGDAAYYSLRAVSWHEVVFGDPLYRPFKVTFAEQWQKRDQLSDEQYPYVVLAELRRLGRDGQADQAIQLGRDALQHRPSLPVAVKVAELLSAAGKAKSVPSLLAFVAELPAIKAAEVPVAAQAAGILEKAGQGRAALSIYDRLLRIDTLSPPMRLFVLGQARKAADSVKDTERSKRWAEEIARLTGRSGS
jgi:uncharacterized protein (TIGR03790 family)